MQQFDSIVEGALSIAQSKAIELRNTQLAPIHLLFGLVKNPNSYSSKKLISYEQQILDLLNMLPKSNNDLTIEQIQASGSFKSWITQAGANATQKGRDSVSERDLLKFLPNTFPNLSIDFSEFKDEDESEDVPEFLIDLNAKAMSGKLDPVIGRSKEIRAVMEILGRRSKNNPVLVGAPGVGKTAIIEGLAEAIVKDKVPDVLKGKTIYSMELGSLLAGTKFRGDFEERIQKLLKFTEAGAGQYIIFIDEIHQLIGAGKTDGAMDAANLLKPALSRGEIHCIGATTYDEYQKYILNDAALERRFRQVNVNEPSKEDSIEILMGIRDKFEGHHGIKINDDAIYSSVYLSDQYITDKNLPDKAIDLIDEAASSLKLSAEAMPADLEFLQSEIRSKSILCRVNPNKELEKEIKELQEEFDKKYIAWEVQVDSLKKNAELKNQYEAYKFDLEKAERNQDYEKASKIKYSLIPELEKEMNKFNHSWELTKEDVASIISRQLGISIEKILKTKQESVLNLEKELNKNVFGQKEAIHEISDSLLTSFAGLSDETKPLGSFLLSGPTGVGKTETAKTLARYLFDDEENIIRVDLSEFSEKHSVAKLIGSPAGYVGYEDGGILTEAVRRRPYSVILFDEVEKAHSDFLDILLQVLDDGRLTDNKGRVINFKNTIILLTTNSKNIEVDFKAEVIGRLDAILKYNSLEREVMKDLVLKQVKLLKERVSDKRIDLSFSDEVVDQLCEIGYDEKYGARPLQRVFSRLVVRPLSKLILSENIENQKVNFTKQNGSIELSHSI